MSPFAVENQRNRKKSTRYRSICGRICDNGQTNRVRSFFVFYSQLCKCLGFFWLFVISTDLAIHQAVLSLAVGRGDVVFSLPAVFVKCYYRLRKKKGRDVRRADTAGVRWYVA